MPWLFLAGLLLSLPSFGAVLRVETVMARPGAMAQIRMWLDRPAAAASGEFSLDLDPAIFADVADVQVFSAAGDVLGMARRKGRRVEVQFTSPSGGVGRLPGMPVAAIHARVLAEARTDAIVSLRVALPETPWKDVLGRPISLESQAGMVRLDSPVVVESVTVSDETVTVTGAGFVPESTVSIPGAAAGTVRYVSVNELRVPVGGAEDLTGRMVRVSGAGGATVVYAAGPRARVEGDVIPLFPLRSLRAFRTGEVAGPIGPERGFAAWNTGSQPVTLEYELLDLFGWLTTRKTRVVEAGEVVVEPSASALGVSRYGVLGVSASLPVRAVQLVTQTTFPGLTPRPVSPVVDPEAYTPFQFPETPYTWSPGDVSLELPQGGVPASRAAASLTKNYRATEDVPVTIAVQGADWLRVEPAVSGGFTYQLQFDSSRLPAGLYSATVVATPNRAGMKAAVLPVRLRIFAGPSLRLIADPANGNFSLTPGGSTTANGTIRVESSGAPVPVTVRIEMGGNPGWLQLSRNSGTTPFEIPYLMNAAGLAPGGYSAQIVVEGQDQTLRFPVSLSYYSPPEAPKPETAHPSSLQYSFEKGAARVTLAGVQIEPAGASYTIATDPAAGWLKAEKRNVGVGGLVSVEADARELGAGTHRTAISILASNGTVALTVPVSVTIWEGKTPALTISPANLEMRGVARTMAEGRVRVESGGLPVQVRAFPAMEQPGCELTAEPSRNGNAEPITPLDVVVRCYGEPGDYRGTVRIQAGTESVTVPVSFHLEPAPYTGQTDPPVLASVVNAASGLAGPIAPGQYVTLHGVGVDVPVLFDGKPGQVSYSSVFQTNVLVPQSLSGRTVLRVGTSERVLPVAAVAPAIFTLDGSGVGAGAVLNQDNAVNGAEAAAERGSIVQVFGTGGSGSPVQARVGGVNADVLYSGTTTPGLWQVNVRIPLETVAGPAVPLVLSIEGAETQPDVTIAVR